MSTDEGSDSEMEGDTPPLSTEPELTKDIIALPARSKQKYLKAHENFLIWLNEIQADNSQRANTFSETVFLKYFMDLAKIKKPSSLWAIYSMLKCTVHVKNGVDMKYYTSLIDFLKKQSAGFKSKKSRILNNKNIMQFLNEAPDYKYLALKAALILGISGACRTIELYNIRTKDIACHDDIMIINLRKSETKIDRTFVVRGEFLVFLKKYLEQRPMGTKTDRFFLYYKNGKCTKIAIGRHKLAIMPKEIATYLNLPEPQCYSGHCFRRSSATILADSEANLCTLKKRGGWKSHRVIGAHKAGSAENRTEIMNEINQNIELETKSHPPTSCHPPTTDCQQFPAHHADAEMNEEVNITSKELLPGPLLVKVEPVFTDDDRTGETTATDTDSRWRNGYRCSSCAGLIVSKFRYACVQCPEFDLCGACEARGVHAAHYVLRIPPCRPLKEIEAVLRKIRCELPLTSTNVVIKLEAEPPQAEVDPPTTQAPDAGNFYPLRKIKTEELEVFIQEHELPPAGLNARPTWSTDHILPDLPARKPAQVACLEIPATNTSKTKELPHRPHAHTSVAVLPIKQKTQNDFPTFRPQKPQADTSITSLPIKQKAQVDASTYLPHTPQTDIAMTDVHIKQEIEIDIPLELNDPSTDNQVVPAVQRKRESLKALRLEAKLGGESPNTAPMSDGSSLEEHTRAAKKKKV